MSAWACPLRTSEEPLVTAYDCAMLDLDGVVYIGPHAVKEVPDVLAQARDLGMTLAFVTNNAARTPADVAGHLRELGVEASRDRRSRTGGRSAGVQQSAHPRQGAPATASTNG